MDTHMAYHVHWYNLYSNTARINKFQNAKRKKGKKNHRYIQISKK